MEKKAKTHRLNRKVIAIATLIILVLILLEVYAHTYVTLYRLPVLAEDEALKIPYYCNGTYTFSSNGASWLFVSQISRPTPSLNHAYLYMFKTEQNGNVLVSNIDLVILGLNPTSNSTGGYFIAEMDEVTYENNYTVVNVSYDIGQIGTYLVDFGLRVKVYQETILGLIPKEETRIPMNATIYYGP
jgi:hypothetical protein